MVPHGDTVLEAGDLVTVVGAGVDFAEIVRTFTSGQAHFPLDFGKRVAVALDGKADLNGSYLEAVNLVRASQATSVLLVHRDPDSIREESRSAQLRTLIDEAPALADGVEVRAEIAVRQEGDEVSRVDEVAAEDGLRRPPA